MKWPVFLMLTVLLAGIVATLASPMGLGAKLLFSFILVCTMFVVFLSTLFTDIGAKAKRMRGGSDADA